MTEEERIPTPLLTLCPSRCVQFMNMISVADLYDEEEIFKVKDDLISECQKFGEVVALEIPRP